MVVTELIAEMARQAWLTGAESWCRHVYASPSGWVDSCQKCSGNRRHPGQLSTPLLGLQLLAVTHDRWDGGFPRDGSSLVPGNHGRTVQLAQRRQLGGQQAVSCADEGYDAWRSSLMGHIR